MHAGPLVPDFEREAGVPVEALADGVVVLVLGTVGDLEGGGQEVWESAFGLGDSD